MVSEDRQRVIEANRSLRNIKNELESLLEKGMITDDIFDSISRQLPTETSIAAIARGAAQPTPAAPSSAMANLSLNSNSNTSPSPTPTPAPPSYSQSTGGGPPPLPGRNQPPPPPGKPILTHARALYAYAASDARDVSFERDDRIAVYEYMNADWWMGRNERTGQEGIFPKNYVEPEAARAPGPATTPGAAPWQNEKAGGYPGAGGYPQPPPQQQQYGAYPAPPPQGNPYNASVPPMAVAQGQPEQQQQGDGGSKVGNAGKKFGKKLGNAAIFGAGATIGSNIVNSIF